MLTVTYYNYFVVLMSDQTLGEFEQIVLLAILRLGENAYGVTICEEIAAKTDRDPSPGALYNTLTRLEDKGLLKSRLGDPTAARGGRAKRFVKLTGQGIAAIARAQRAYQNLLQGVPLPGMAHG
jgi:PadR family transcriptional regulator PadR